MQAWEEDQVYLSSHLNYPLAYAHIAGSKTDHLKMYFDVCPNFVAKHWLPGTLLLKSSSNQSTSPSWKKNVSTFFSTRWAPSKRQHFPLRTTNFRSPKSVFNAAISSSTSCGVDLENGEIFAWFSGSILWIHRILAIFTKTAQETARICWSQLPL